MGEMVESFSWPAFDALQGHPSPIDPVAHCLGVIRLALEALLCGSSETECRALWRATFATLTCLDQMDTSSLFRLSPRYCLR